MNTEEKARRYDEALNWMREIYPGLHGATKEDAEHFFPELAESEDEMIRKFLVKHVSEWIGCIEHDLKISSKDVESEEELAMFKAGLAWLEKQKEQKPLKLGENAYFDTNTDMWFIKKEQKPVEYLDNDKVYAIMNKLHNLSFSQRIPINSDEYKQINEITNDVRDILDYPIEQKSAEKQDYSGLNDLERAIHRGFLSAGVENVPVTIIKETARECLAQMKPAEWSEEDDWKRKELIQYLEEKGDYRTVWMTWLKSLPERFNLEPKEEWSDEDTEMYINVASSLRGYACGLENEEHKRHIQKGLDWLENRFKSLRPQPKQEWSEEDEKMYKAIIIALSLNSATSYMRSWGITLEDADSWLKSLRHQYHGDVTMTEAYKMGLEAGKASSWKPSEEQESVAEKFARIVRGNLIGIDKEVQQKFEQLYFEVTGNKMYGGYND